MAKVKVRVGYTDYVMDDEAAFALFRSLNGADVERVESSYNSETKTQTMYIKSVDGFLTLQSIAAEDYAVWKLAGASRNE